MCAYSQPENVLTIDTLLTFSPEDFTVFCPDDEQGCLILSDKYGSRLSYGGLVGEPSMPYIAVNVYHSNMLSCSAVEASVQEHLFADDIVMMINPTVEPNLVHDSPNLIGIGSDGDDERIYPTSPVEFATEIYQASLSDRELGYTILRVYPFRYNANDLKLYLNETIKIKITYQTNSPVNISNIPNSQMVNGKSVARPWSLDPSRNGQWYDLSGRRIDNSPLPRGIYIKDGRKTAVK